MGSISDTEKNEGFEVVVVCICMQEGIKTH